MHVQSIKIELNHGIRWSPWVWTLTKAVKLLILYCKSEVCWAKYMTGLKEGTDWPWVTNMCMWSMTSWCYKFNTYPSWCPMATSTCHNCPWEWKLDKLLYEVRRYKPWQKQWISKWFFTLINSSLWILFKPQTVRTELTGEEAVLFLTMTLGVVG